MSIRRTYLSLLCLLALAACNPAVPDPGPEVPDTPSEQPQEPEQPEQPQEPQEPEQPEQPDYDGLVTPLLKASRGKGLDIVIMGDGFTEEDHRSGRYAEVMKGACSHLFTVEPLTSLRDWFNVWSVGVVSADSKLDGTSGLKCRYNEPTGATEKLIDSYGRKITGIALDSTVFCIIINNKVNGGVCHHKSYRSQKAFAYCPMIPSTPGSDNYRLALVHEVFGHGFAKLADEYTMSGYEKTAPTDKDATDLASHQKLGYDLNVSFTRDSLLCPWKDFLFDSRYAGDGLGFYEGVGYFGRKAYRSTRLNLMNQTTGKDMQFSAPQRRIIYDRTIRRGEGRTPGYEEFVAFDKKS